MRWVRKTLPLRIAPVVKNMILASPQAGRTGLSAEFVQVYNGL